ncbi:MAG: glycosyltransferase [Lachnospiraceae bacterium]|nr:glycosyltransferase [Lachnospiraceae bacterium]
MAIIAKVIGEKQMGELYKISVIIPVYNVKTYLRQCVESVINQEFDSFEVILVDDGSTDGSGEICDEMELQYSYVKVVHKKNGGLGSARNVGVSISNGRYLIFVDSDDWLAEGALEGLFGISERDRLDIALFAAQNIYEDAVAQEQMSGISYERKNFLNEVMLGEDYIKKVLPMGEYLSSVCLRMYRTKFYKENKFEFCENIIHEDEDVSFLSCLCAERIKVVPDKYYMRRFRSGSIMTSKTYIRSAEGYRYAWGKLWELIGKTSENKTQLCVKYSSMFTDICIGYYINAGGSEKRKLARMAQEMCKRQRNVVKSRKYNAIAISPFAYSVYNRIREKKHILDESIRLRRLESGYFRNWIKSIFNHSKKIYLIGTPTHGNVGDHLIAKSEYDYLSSRFPNNQVIEISLYYCRRFYKKIKRRIHKNDIICVSGGGWLGDCWINNELFVQRIISDFQENTIIILPQTIFYSANSKMIESAKNIYSLHENLLVCVRDKQSEDVALNKLKLEYKQVVLMPDFALLYHSEIINTKGHCIGICFRKDREMAMTQSERDELMEYLSQSKYSLVNINTNDETRVVARKNRKKYIDEIMLKISKCDLLITDRLHAMIICALVGTPCIVFDNSTHKVAGVYDAWLSEFSYIKMAENNEKLYEDIIEFLDYETLGKEFSKELYLYGDKLAEVMKKLGV